MNEIKDNMVSHPAHYQSKTGLEVFDVIEAFTSDLEGIEAFDAGNIIKYICRWKNKNGLQDLKKAREYLDHLIKHIEGPVDENRDIPKYEPFVYFFSRSQAEKALETMKNMVKTYGFVTLGELYDIAEVSGHEGEDDTGWVETQFERVHVIKVRDGYTLNLPKPVFLDFNKKGE